jgi:uncharacterized protein involved in exopolysaccharide biosynthesis
MVPPTASSAPPPVGTEALLVLTATVLRHRRLTLGLPVLVLVATLAVGLLRARSYTAITSFVPESQDANLGELAGLAAQFGVAVPGRSAAQSPEFYADLIGTRAILGPLVQRRVAGTRQAVDSVPLGELLQAHGADSAARHEDGIRRLRKRLTVGADAKTSVVTVQVETRWPAVSAAVARWLVEAVVEFDLHTRQSRASAERRFTDERLEQARTEMRESEDALESFLAGKRQYRVSPTLVLRFDRLSREVASRQQVLDALRKSFEQSRIEEVRNTPRITVIETATLPAKPDSRQLVLKLLLAGIASALVGLVTAVGIDGLDRTRQDRREDVEDLHALWQATLGDLRRPWRFLVRPAP